MHGQHARVGCAFPQERPRSRIESTCWLNRVLESVKQKKVKHESVKQVAEKVKTAYGANDTNIQSLIRPTCRSQSRLLLPLSPPRPLQPGTSTTCSLYSKRMRWLESRLLKQQQGTERRVEKWGGGGGEGEEGL